MYLVFSEIKRECCVRQMKYSVKILDENSVLWNVYYTSVNYLQGLITDNTLK